MRLVQHGPIALRSLSLDLVAEATTEAPARFDKTKTAAAHVRCDERLLELGLNQTT